MMSVDIVGSTALTEQLAEESPDGAEEIITLLSEIFGQLIAVSTRLGGDVLEFSGDSMLVLFSEPDHERAAAMAGVQMQRVLSALMLADEYGLAIRVGAHSETFDVFLVGQIFKQLIVAGPAASRTIVLESQADTGKVHISHDLADTLPDSWLAAETAHGWELIPDLEYREPPSQTSVHRSTNGADRLVNPVIAEGLSLVDTLGGEHRPAAVAFLDVQGIEEMLEVNGSEHTEAAIEAVLDAAVRSADRYEATYLTNGVTDEGFKLTLLAGAPTSKGADLEALVRTMLEVLAIETELSLRGGITQGQVFTGFLGPPARHEYAAMGDVVNLAARLLKQAGPGELVTTPEVVETLGDQLQTEARSEVTLKGKAAPIVPYRVLSIKSESGSHMRSLIDDKLLLVGREQELEELNELVDRMADGDFAFVGSDVGMGAHRMLKEIKVDEESLVSVRCNRYDKLAPFASIRPALLRLLKFEGDDPNRTLVELADSLPAELAPLLPLTNPVFGSELGHTEESARTTDHTELAEIRAELIVELLVMNLEASTMLLVEDLHFADSASVALLESIARAADLPLVTVLTGPFEAVELLSSPPPTRIDIGPIDHRTATDLARRVAKGHALSDHQINDAVRRANGNPLFLIELTRAVISGGELPQTIDGVIRARIDQLSSEDRHLLRVASVLGAEFELEVLDQLLSKLNHLAWSSRLRTMPHLIEVSEDRALFVRDLYRDVCYKALRKSIRAEIHLAAGLIMEESGRTGDGDLGLLALHFDEAGYKERAWQYSKRAGWAAAAAGAPVEAVASFQRALDAAHELETVEGREISSVQEALGDALFRSGSLKRAARAYAEATRINDQDGRLQLLRKIGTARERSGKLKGAELWFRRALAEIPETTESEQLLHHRMQLQLAITGLRHRQNRHEEIRTTALAALKDATRLGDVPNIALANERLLLGTIYGDGEPDLEAGEEALRIYEKMGDDSARFRVLNNLAIADHLSCKWDRALRRYEEANEAARKIGDVTWVGYGHNNRAEIFSNRGDFRTAGEELEEASRIWRAAEYATGKAAAAMNMGLLLGRQHDIRAARRKLEDAVAHFLSVDATYEANEARLRLAEVLLISKLPPRQAKRVLDEVAATTALPRQQKITLARLQCYSSVARGHLDDDALRDMDSAERLARAGGADYDLALVWLAKAAANHGDAKLLRVKANDVFARLKVVHPTPLIHTTLPKSRPR